MQPIYSLISYIFDPLPPSDFKYLIALAILAAIILGCSIYLRLRIRKDKENRIFRRLFRGFPVKIESVAYIILINLLARYYHVAFLSMRLILFCALATAVYLAYRIADTHIKQYPLEKKRHHEQSEKNKYIPRKNHK
jgi:amino acid transporter